MLLRCEDHPVAVHFHNGPTPEAPHLHFQPNSPQSTWGQRVAAHLVRLQRAHQIENALKAEDTCTTTKEKAPLAL